MSDLPTYDAGVLADYGSGNVEWWQDYIRAELARAHNFYAEHFTDRLEALAQPVVGEQRDDVERYIRIAIWNAGMNGGMGQDLSQAFIRRAMAEPTMIHALAALAASPSPVVGCSVGSCQRHGKCMYLNHPQCPIAPVVGDGERRAAREALAIKLSSIASNLQGEHGEWTWMEIADAILSSTPVGQPVADALKHCKALILSTGREIPVTDGRVTLPADLNDAERAELRGITPVMSVSGEADGLVATATGGRFADLTAFTEAMLSAQDEGVLDEMVGEAATLLHAFAALSTPVTEAAQEREASHVE